MPRNKAPMMTLGEAKARFEEWRNNRSGKARIPAVLALPTQTGCGAALRNTRPAKSCSSIENHHADLQPERWVG